LVVGPRVREYRSLPPSHVDQVDECERHDDHSTTNDACISNLGRFSGLVDAPRGFTFQSNRASLFEVPMTDPIRAELRRLRLLTVMSLVAFAVLAVSAFRQDQRVRFTEIDVERINIVEPDGKLRMVLSNRPRSTGPIYKGQPFGYEGGTRPGVIFFNDEGTE